MNSGDMLPELVMGPITEAGIAAFAQASGDRNPIHLDHAAARDVGLPGIIVHGMLTMAYLGRFITDRFGIAAVRRLETRFSAMAFPGDTLTFRARVQNAAEPSHDDGLTRLELEVANQRGETVLTGLAAIALSDRDQ